MSNELIICITVLGMFAVIRYCFFQGRLWLQASIVINLILISVFGAKLIPVFGEVTNVGNVFYAMVFFATQLLVEHYGKAEARKSILLGSASIIFFIFIGQMTVLYTGISAAASASNAMAALFQFTPRLALASITAYILAQSLNILVYSVVREKRPSQIWLRSISASAAGQIVDSVIFFTIAFAGILPGPILIQSMLIGFTVKFSVGVLSIPFLYSSYLARTKREILEEEAEAILLSVGEGLVMTDRDGKIILINKSFSQMLGWSESEVIGKPMVEVIEREDETGNKISFQNRMLTGVLAGKSFATSSVNHSYFVRKDKTRFPVKIVATPVLIDRAVMGAVETFFDVTEEKTLDKMRADFLIIASHQLRTPLAGTRWLLETLLGSILGGTLNKRQREYVEDLYRINSRMILLVSELLNTLHIQSGRITIRKESLLPAKIFDEALVMLRPVAKYADITLEIHENMPATEVQTDLALAKTILESLISNAITYSRKNGKVLLEAQDMGKEIVFSVKDSGIGIPPEEQKMMFEKFYRASNAQLSKPDGSGLGLYTAAMLAEKIGAKITFESIQSKGSTFFLHIPKVSSSGQ